MTKANSPVSAYASRPGTVARRWRRGRRGYKRFGVLYERINFRRSFDNEEDKRGRPAT